MATRNAVIIKVRKHNQKDFETDSIYVDHMPGFENRIKQHIQNAKDDGTNAEVKIEEL
jgi:hypothetical protein